MAATGKTPILIYGSTTATNTPSAANLTNSSDGCELAVNVADGYLFYKDTSNAVQKIGYKLVPIANGGTNATSFNAPASSINGLVWFDGTRLVNDATTADIGYNASTNTFYANNAIVSGTLSVGGNAVSGAAPQVTIYTSGTGTYTVPSGAKYLIVEMVGGGGGGAGGGTASWGAGGNGGNTTFGSNIAAFGYGAAVPFSLGGAGGGYTISGATGILGVIGCAGRIGDITTLGNAQANANGGDGGNTFLAGGGYASVYVSGAGAGIANTGGGGGGGSGGNSIGTLYGGSGGGGGGYLKLLVTSPSATYSYAVGAGGTAGAAGTGSNATGGGAGASGVISITAYF